MSAACPCNPCLGGGSATDEKIITNDPSTSPQTPTNAVVEKTGVGAALSSIATPTEAPKKDDQQPIPCYLPQTQDARVQSADEGGGMGPVGPWATGRMDWSPLAGMTGTRPIVDKYSITRRSEVEWRRHNADILGEAETQQRTLEAVAWRSRDSMKKIQNTTDRTQETITGKLRTREQDVHRRKMELEKEIEMLAEEIRLTEQERRRLQHASEVLLLPESIAGECLERRTGRLDPELVRDDVEEELIKELALTAEIREVFVRTLKDVEGQLEVDKVAKQRLEYDWSDKKTAHEVETFAISLNTKSRNLQFKPGSVIFPHDQSNPEYWDHFTEETLMAARTTRQKSADLRATLDAILLNGARDLRTQADKVELALKKRTGCTQEVTQLMENELKTILQKLADVEILRDDLMAAIRRMDTAMKKAHTRLDQRLQRPRVENCRDTPHYGLVDEVKQINENVSALHAQLKEAEKTQSDLIQARNNLEREIMVKKRTLEIDIGRCREIRSFYPSASALSGY